jgi:hypothetical protein
MVAGYRFTHRPPGAIPGGTPCPIGRTLGPRGRAADSCPDGPSGHHTDQMICEVDESLRALLVAALPDGTGVDLERDAETDGVHAALTTIHEDVTGLPANWADLRDDRGVVIARRPPIHRYELRYTVTVRAGSTGAEHALLDAVLTMVSSTTRIGPPHLHEHFADCGLPVLIRLDEHRPELIAERPVGLDLVITAPLLTGWTDEVAPTPDEFALDAGRGRAPVPATPIRPPRPMRARRIREDN